jgi:hypothetical protein
MTATLEADATEAPKKRGRPKGQPVERDFTKHTEDNASLAEFINADEKVKEAGITVTPFQVKAILALRSDWADTPERKAEREKRKAEREAEKKQFAGMTDEEIKAEKAARRAEKSAEKMQAKVQEALDRAKAIREGKDLSGADLAAAVESQQNGAEGKRKLPRK